MSCVFPTCIDFLIEHFTTFSLYSLSATYISTSTSSYYISYRETVPTHLSNVNCQGSEMILTNCNHTLGGSGTAVSMRCYSNYGMSF